jgi:hypothetical protein
VRSRPASSGRAGRHPGQRSSSSRHARTR